MTTTRVPEEKRERILALLGQGKSYRQIQDAVGCGSGLIAQVKREANRPLRRSVAPSEPERAPGASGGDGLTEFIPPAEPKRPPPVEKRSGSASGSAPADGGAAQDEVYECGHCHVRWTLDSGEAQVGACPNPDCGVAFA